MKNPFRAHGFGVRQLVGGERIEGTFGEVRGERLIKRQRKSMGNLWRGGRKKIKTKTKRGQRNLWRGEGTKNKKKTKKGHGGTFREVRKQKKGKDKKRTEEPLDVEWEQILRKRKDIGNLWSGKN